MGVLIGTLKKSDFIAVHPIQFYSFSCASCCITWLSANSRWYKMCNWTQVLSGQLVPISAHSRRGAQINTLCFEKSTCPLITAH